jgi:hypothetical protein
MDLIYIVSIWLLPVLIAITFHEAAHGFVARFLGDETASRLGRLSLNPLAQFFCPDSYFWHGHRSCLDMPNQCRLIFGRFVIPAAVWCLLRRRDRQ